MELNESGVSPVIGVLLMLTLTLIIVAIVNSYAGGLMETEPKAPSATIQATYSQSNGMEIRHVSGDPIPTSGVKVIIRPTESFGRTAPQYAAEINKLYVTNSSGDLTWASGISSMKAGDISYIHGNKTTGNLTHLQDIPGIPSEFLINRTTPGNTFYLELYYKNTMISRNEVLIEQ